MKIIFALLFALSLSANAQTYQWRYDGFGAPKEIQDSDAIRIMQKSLDAWQGCAGTPVHTEKTDGTHRILFTWGTMPDDAGKTSLMQNRNGTTLSIIRFDNQSVKKLAQLRDLAIHEIGHAFGLPHSVSRNSVMNGETRTTVKIPQPEDISWCKDVHVFRGG